VKLSREGRRAAKLELQTALRELKAAQQRLAEAEFKLRKVTNDALRLA
jgi:hypothetical protein